MGSLSADEQAQMTSRVDTIADAFGSPVNDRHAPIAVVGMGMRLPGQVNSSESFWNFLMNKGDGRCRVPKDRYNVDAFYSAEPKAGTVKSEYGYFLQDSNLGHLDTSFFSMNQAEVERLDPQQRILLEVVWECFQSAGETQWRGKDIGCYVGVYGGDWLDMNSRDTLNAGAYRLTGIGDFVLGNRISYEYDLKGPSMTIKTGCSSTLVGLHEACNAIQKGQCPAALVCGTNLIIDPGMTVAMTEQGVLASDGRSKSFDAAADGYARAEAVNAVYIKPLTDALANNDPIRAIIRATATNSDGKTPGIAHPNPESHVDMMRRTHASAGLDTRHTTFVECHGPGTPTGDVMEGNAVAQVFHESGVFIGSVKPNFGHSEGAAGGTSLIKVVLALENQTIPPQINFRNPNPKIPFGHGRLTVPTRAVPWPVDKSQRASINSFGFGGANAHAILDSTHRYGIKPKATSSALPFNLLLFSANHPKSLDKLVNNHQEYLQRHPMRAPDLAYTLACRRKHLSHRSFHVWNGSDVIEASSPQRSGNVADIIFVFTGQGAQWPCMARELILNVKSFANDIKHLQKYLGLLPDPPTWNIKDELLKSSETSQLSDAEIAQPLCTAIQIALVNLLESWGIFPKAVVGHSSGEIAAAYACGGLTAQGAITTAYYRGKSLKSVSAKGTMAAVGLGPAEVQPYLMPGVIAACENSPQSTTISGDEKAVGAVTKDISEDRPEVFVRRLKVDKAYHSHQMKEVGPMFEDYLSGRIQSRPPFVPFYSAVTGKPINSPNGFDPHYWRDNLESKVLFSTAVSAITNDGPNSKLFLEIGPHSALGGPIKQILKAQNLRSSYVPTLIRNDDGLKCMLSTAGKLYQHNYPLHLEKIAPPGSVLTDLPIYPWHHEKEYWSESRLSKDFRLRRFPRHDILGSRILEGNDLEPTWRNVIHLDEVSWISDHKVDGDIVFPAAGYLAMAVEAIRQLVNDPKGFSLRSVSIGKALVIKDAKDIEVMTHLRPKMLTTSDSSRWYEFQISSFTGSEWEKNCSGEIKCGTESPSSLPTNKACTRKISSSKWYRTLRETGLNYTGLFQGMKDISAGVGVTFCEADLENSSGPYLLHPATLDSALQMLSVAMSNGLSRRFDRVFMPTWIETLEIRPGKALMHAYASVSTSSRSRIEGSVSALAEDGLPRASMHGIQMSPLETSKESNSDRDESIAYVDWRPSIDFLNPADLILPTSARRHSRLICEKLTLFCIIQTALKLQNLQTNLPYLDKYKSWLDYESNLAQDGRYKLIDDGKDFAKLPAMDRQRLIEETYFKAKATDATALAVATMSVFHSASEVFQGKSQALEPLMRDNVLEKLYNWLVVDWTAFLELLCHQNPNMRILEIGAGTGGTTAAVLKSLLTKDSRPNYASYTYTDVSAGFFGPARDRFSYAPNMEYSVLDISNDPFEQGFEAKTYDLILAANVLHATPKIGETLSNVQKLLRPGGRLLLQELSPELRSINYIMGVLPGWWLGEEDGRSSEPFLTMERWGQELKKAGFNGLDAGIYDDEIPYQMNMSLLSTCSVSTPQSSLKLALLCQERTTAHEVVFQFLESKGYDVVWTFVADESSPDCLIISLLDQEKPFLAEMSPEDWTSLRTYLSRVKPKLLWVTHAVHMDCQDPRFGFIHGVARTLRSELAIDITVLEVDSWESHTWPKVCELLDKLQIPSQELDFDEDREYTVKEGAIYNGRYDWRSTDDQILQAEQQEDTGTRTLDIGTYGLLQTLQWESSKIGHVQPDEVLVDISHIGMNFRDVLVAMGQVDQTEVGLGSDASGVVRGIGKNVPDLVVGDRVMLLAKGCFTNRKIISRSLCAKIPDDLTLEDAATMPSVYSTVIHSLCDIGRLEQGQSVLIHSGAGGVGLAAVNICRMIGAEIYVTVGTPEKATYLAETCHIARDHIFNSRDASFYPAIMQGTGGKGVDLVLNSLSGELLHLSWKCLASFGSFIELGKRDFNGHGKLNMETFGSNRSFSGVDLGQLCTQRPKTVNRLLLRCVELLRQGHIAPIHPIRSFAAVQIEDAFRYLQKGQHIGKVTVSMPSQLSSQRSADLLLRPDATYILVGGLGGLGRAISVWLVERGAKHLTFMSRSAGTAESDRSFFEELKGQGCDAEAFAGDVADPTAVRRMIEDSSRPVAGVLQMSMVLQDRAFGDMSFEDWQTAINPKVTGTMNLHNALASQPVEFFVLFSSLSGLIGQVGQANYAAANTFLDSFVRYRHGMNLPAATLDIGLVGDIGYLSEKPSVLNQLQSLGIQEIQEATLLKALRLAIVRSRPPPRVEAPKNSKPPLHEWIRPISNFTQFTVGLKLNVRFDDPKNRTLWKRDARMSRYRNIAEDSTEYRNASSSGSGDEELANFLSAVAANAAMLDDEARSADFLAQQMGAQLKSFMLLSDAEDGIDVSKAPSALGVDSLVSIEIRNWWRQVLRLEISVLEIMNAKSIQELGIRAVEGLKEKHVTREK